MKWNTFTVQELIELGYIEPPMDGNHGSLHPKTSDYVEEGIPFLMVNDMKDGEIDFENCAFISEKQAHTLRKGFAKPGDVLLSHKATIGRTAIVPSEYDTIVLTPQITYYRVKKGINNRYLKYYFDSPVFQGTFENWANSGSTRAYLGITAQHNLPIQFPDLMNQEKIASILGALDEKIVFNKKINKNLEQQAQAIFKSWFVDFEPFNGEMPHNWIVSRLGDIASIKTNSFSPVKNPDAQLEHYSIPAYDEQNYPVFESAADIKSNKYILSKNSVMISKLNPDTKRVWRPMCLSELAVSSTEFIIFEAFNPAYRDFVFSIIDSAAFSDWMCAHTTGSTNSRQRTAPSATLEFQVALPDEKAIIDFCAIVTPMYDTIASNICENQKLAQLRDSILPKLMSGELDVSNIDL